MRFLDNVIQDFIDNAPETMNTAAYSAMRERSVGLGVMGLHSFFQANNILGRVLLQNHGIKKYLIT